MKQQLSTETTPITATAYSQPAVSGYRAVGFAPPHPMITRPQAGTRAGVQREG